ncbi:MAG: maleylpyruvate isomerase family mycothiol-dependent enzyme, partial [Umezawaea sp.]
MDFDRHRAEIVAQTELLAAAIEGADLTAPVPSCPGWNVGQLVRHLGGGQRWSADVVRTRATEPPPDDFFRDLTPYADEDPAVVAPWLTVGALALSEALSEAGPEARMWTPLPGGTPLFWARRFAHETVVHRADAVLALGQEFVLDPEVAVDTVDEWMDLGSLPVMLEIKPGQR